jgi:hypothetical protein
LNKYRHKQDKKTIKRLNKMITIKKTLTFAFVLASFAGFSQKSISQNITSENGQLKIHVEMDENGKKQVFDKSYNVEGLSENEKQALIEHVTDSLTAGSNKNMKMKVKIKRDINSNNDNGMVYQNGNERKGKKKVIIKDYNQKNGDKKVDINIDEDDDMQIDEDVDIDINGMDFDMKDIQNGLGDLGKTLKFKFDEFGPMMQKFGDDMAPHLKNLGNGNFFNFDGESGAKTVKNLNAFPNKPNNNKLNIRFIAPEKGNITITVTDLNNKEIGKEKISDFTGEYIGQVDLKGTNKGTIFVTVVQGEDGATKRVVLN